MDEQLDITAAGEESQLAQGRADNDAYRELFERSADAILIIEGDTFVDCNQATVDMLRCDNKEQVLRTHPSELSPPIQPDGRDSFEKANEIIATAFEHGSHRFEWDHVRADGEVFPVEVLLTAVQERGKRILHVVWRDITDRKKLEDRLRQSQKMEAIGKLAGGIAHDFNNLLVAIIGHADLLGRALSGDPRKLESAEQIKQAGQRGARLVRQLLAFSRKQEIQPQILALDQLVANLESLLKSLLGEDLKLRIKGTETPIFVQADPGQIEQIVINLATNSRDAMPRGGRLSIEVRELNAAESIIGMTQRLEPGRYALLKVSDTGCGMDSRTCDRAFEPFFTTKTVGKGTGLGLATVYGIVQQSDGAIGLHSVAGRGTTVNVYLPAVEPVASQASPAMEASELRGGTETVLAVEDDGAVSSLVGRVLQAEGYRLLQARDGEQALEIWTDYADEIDLVLTDVVMPNMGGVTLFRELRARQPELPILFASGYTDEALADLRKLGEEIDLLEKPFTPETLVRRVRRILDRHQASR